MVKQWSSRMSTLRFPLLQLFKGPGIPTSSNWAYWNDMPLHIDVEPYEQEFGAQGSTAMSADLLIEQWMQSQSITIVCIVYHI